jgi:hypothetical protein
MNLDASLSTAEATQESMVAPGQEALLEDFVKEQEAAQQDQETEKLLGKFNTADELARAYQELERKLGQRSQPTQEDLGSPSDESTDDSEAEAPGQRVMSEDEVNEIKALVGGEDGFKQLGQWARENLPASMLDDYNAVVAQGNVDAIRWAVRALMAQASQGQQEPLVEPELVGGGKADNALRFESQAQVLDAMNKKNTKGQRMYDVDEAYRDRVQQALMRSDVF